VGQTENLNTVLKMAAGGKAFREYAAFADRIGLSRAGNLRGMVVSARWHTVFHYLGHSEEYLKNLGTLAAISAGLVEAAPKIEAIHRSTDSAALKGMRYSSVAGTIAQRVLAGSLTSGVHLIYRSLEGWCMIGGLAGGRAQSVASEGIKTLHHADTLVETFFKTITDTDKLVREGPKEALWSVITIKTKPR
jgi:hypothetical protein